MVKIVIFASGSGSNAEQIMKHFAQHTSARVVAVFTNNAKAGVIDRAAKYDIPVEVFNREQFYNSTHVVDALNSYGVDIIALAGFLWLVPASMLKLEVEIVNIHPALLPKYGGHGMYGSNVHRAVKEAGEKESGITIHLIDEEYDRGSILLQEKCTISPSDSPEEIAAKVLKLEHRYYPVVIEQMAVNRSKKS